MFNVPDNIAFSFMSLSIQKFDFIFGRGVSNEYPQ